MPLQDRITLEPEKQKQAG